jgi:hypothetical protein
MVRMALADGTATTAIIPAASTIAAGADDPPSL